MGVVKVTPDSFFAGGRYLRHDDAVEHERQLIADGAAVRAHDVRPTVDAVGLVAA
jgi:dihydropteroate synthase